MQESINCINFIKSFEKFLPSPTYDIIGRCWNIGYGTTHYPTNIRVKANDSRITEEEATNYLKYYVNVCVASINKGVKVILNQSQFDACICLAYNIGAPKFLKSTLLQVINNNRNDLDNIKEQWLSFDCSKGEHIRGLLERRKKEYNMYISNLNI